jgi:dienelactone hydrolase
MRVIAILLMLVVLVAANPAMAQGDLIEEAGLLRVAIGSKVVRLEALTVKRAGATGRLPIALIAHGKTGTQERMSDQHTQDYIGQARDLARRGWLAVVAMRRGFGRSDGPLPVDLSCASTSFLDRLESDADDLAATLHSISLRPDADPAHVIVIGESTGGVDATALSARNPPGLMAVINVSGGMRFDECPKEEELVAAFRTYGARSRVPSLWIYARNDSFFRPELVERMRAAYLEGGGIAKLVMLEPDGKDGHAIFATSTGRVKWLSEMDSLLRALKLPTWTGAEVEALMQKLAVKEQARKFVEGYVAAPSEKALAREKGGSYFGEGFGGPTMENARQSAMAHCLQVKPACEIIIENDHWLGPELRVAEPPPAAPPNNQVQSIPRQ